MFTTRFGEDEPPSHAVTRALAAREGVHPTELAPLYEFVDLEALDAIFTDRTGTDDTLAVEFHVDQYHVTVCGDRTVAVRDRGRYRLDA